MTESELLHEVSESFYGAFGLLVADHLKRVPRHLQDDLLERLQEHANVYGSNYSTHMDRETPLIEKARAAFARNQPPQ